MKILSFTELTRKRIAKWMIDSQPVDENNSWVEQRLAIEVGGKLHIIHKGQVFQCDRCGHFDTDWSATEVLKYLKETMNIIPIEVDVRCTVESY